MEVLSSRVLVKVDNLDETVEWWTTVLGLSIAREYGVDGHRTGVAIFCGGTLVEFSRTGSTPSALTLWMQVPNLAAESDRLLAAGVESVEAPERKPWGLDEWRFTTPEGVEIVLVEVPAAHPLRQRFVIDELADARRKRTRG